MTTISNDSLSRPYAAIDVSVYDPLVTDTWTIESLARVLALLTIGYVPPDLAEYGASAPKIPGDPASKKEAAEWDAYAPSRVFGNALAKLHRSLYSDTTGEATKKLGNLRNPFVPNKDRRALIDGGLVEDALLALRAMATKPSVAEASVDKQRDKNWDTLIDTALTRFKEAPPTSPIRISRAAPFGLLHRYRQHFLYSEVRAGPLELVKALAPGELLEVVLTEMKSSTFEKTMESELEVTTSRSVEETDKQELSDRVASSVSRSATVTASANGSYNAVLWSGGGSASSTVTESSTNTTEKAVTRLQETTRKQSEQIRKKTTVTTRVVESRSESTTTRHVIQNKENASANYGLRRLGYDVDCKVQDLGPLLVWQSFVSRPGEFLARSRFIDLEWEDPKPTYPLTTLVLTKVEGGNHPGMTTIVVPIGGKMLEMFNAANKDQVPDKEQIVHFYSEACVFMLKSWAVQEDYGSYDRPNLIYTSSRYDFEHTYDEKTRSVTFKLKSGDPPPRWFNFHVEGTFDVKLRKDPEELKDPDGNKLDERAMRFQRIKSIFDGPEKARGRNTLEYEERKALLGKVISLVAPELATGPLPVEQLQSLYLEINDIFDLPGMFYDIDVAEWGEARLSSVKRIARQPYDIHSGQRGTAPLGASLGWEHQIDADSRRDMFLNAPFAWVGVPVKLGKEAEAASFLRGYGKLLEHDRKVDKLVYDLRKIRAAEKAVSKIGFDESEVVVDKDTRVNNSPRNWLHVKPSTKNLDDPDLESPDDPLDDEALQKWIDFWDGKLKWADVYPIVSQQHTVTTVEGFIFDELKLGGQWTDEGKPRPKPKQ